MGSRILPAVCIAAPMLFLLNSACGIFDLPKSGPEAMGANMQAIKFTVAIVDQGGVPLDGVKVSYARYTQEASLGWGGKHIQTHASQIKTADKVFSYDGLGQAGVWVQFEKDGYETQQRSYANADALFLGSNPIGSHGSQACMNVSQGNPPAVRMVKQELKRAN